MPQPSMPRTARLPTALSVLAAALIAGGCGDSTPDALEQARESIDAQARQTERAIEDEKIGPGEARRICRSAATGIPSESAAADAVEICVDVTLNAQQALRKVDTDALEKQLGGK